MFFSKNKGILGINARNLLYIKPYNPNKAIKLADNKIKTKQFLSARGIPVPKLFGSIRNLSELEKFDFNALPQSFVVKPSEGYGGEGIIPITSKKSQIYQTASGEKINLPDLKTHIRDILDGRFSISGATDIAFFEQYIVSHETLARYSYAGLPDIRIIVHNLIPVMAMLRLPTKESKGKANLHQGAIGVGIDIAKGQTTHLSYKNHIIDELPNGLGRLNNLKIPFWNEMLMIASQVQLITNLGYMAVDLAIDHHTGPVLLEINARAGLGLQIANLAPLRKRLERIEGISVSTPQKGVRIAKDIFGNNIEKEIASISGKQIIGTEEPIKIIRKDGTINLQAKINTSKKISTIDKKFAIEKQLINSKEAELEKTIKLKLSLKSKRIQTIAEFEDLQDKDYKMILGTRDLTEFLIDTSKKREKEIRKIYTPKSIENTENFKSNFQEVDQQLNVIEDKIKLLHHLKPVNLGDEEIKFFKNFSKSPQFEYPKLSFNPVQLTEQLHDIKIDNSPWGKIFHAKREEISLKIQLLEALDEERFTDISVDLYGKPNHSEIEKCEELIEKLKNKPKTYKEKVKYFNAQEVQKKFEEILDKYQLNKWKVKIKDQMVADCISGKRNSLFINKNTRFSEKKLQALIVHEIETHILTAENGKKQPYQIFNRGLKDYLITQEGLAMYNVTEILNQPLEENQRALANVLAIQSSIGHSFVETFHKLIEKRVPPKQAFKSTLKAKRGFYNTDKKGAFTKDYLYFKGYYQIKEFIQNGGDIKALYLGKINCQDLEEILKLPGIIEPQILPTWLKK